jgi:orotate phosphoribosyltransferase
MPLALRYSDNARVLSVSLSRMLRRSRELIKALPKVSIISPGSGGIPVAFEILEVFKAEQIFWGEREGGVIRFRQYLQIAPGQQCLIVDDIARSGNTIRKIYDMLTEAGANVLGVGVLLRFNIAQLDLPGVPVHSLVDFETVKYRTRDECPLCAEGVPVEVVRY